LLDFTEERANIASPARDVTFPLSSTARDTKQFEAGVTTVTPPKQMV